MASLSNFAAQTLQRQIVDGRYKAGEPLPPQRELSETLGISRASLREAISMLEALGLVRSQAGKGVFVTAGTTRSANELPSGPAAASPADIYQFRFVIEPAAASFAARRSDAAAHARLADTVDGMKAALDSLDLLTTADWDLRFHLLIAELSGNASLRGALTGCEAQLGYSLRLPFADRSRVWETYDEHRAIFDAIAAGDATAARRAMEAHLLASAGRVGVAFEQP